MSWFMQNETVEQATGVSKSGLSFLLLMAVFAAISAISHSRLHLLSQVTWGFTLLFGFFAVVKIINSIASVFPNHLKMVLHWVHAMTFEILAFTSSHLLHFMKKNTAPIGSGRPILLVHGYCNDSSVWIYLRRKLAQQGLVYTVDLGNPFRSIRDYAKIVEDKVAQIKQETGSDVLLIGHSMGGLVSLCAPFDNVAEVITLAAPLRGTHIAKVGFGPNAREMERNSTLIQELSAKIAQEKKVRFSTIGTKTDQLVIPGHSALLDQSRQFLFEDIGHASLLFSPRVAALLTQWIYAQVHSNFGR